MLKIPLAVLATVVSSAEISEASTYTNKRLAISDWQTTFFEKYAKKEEGLFTDDSLWGSGKFSIEPAPTIKDWDNELPTLICHGINDECDTGLIRMIKGYIRDTGTNSNKTLFTECIVEGKNEEWTSIFGSMH